MKFRRTVMRNHCRRVAEQHRDATRGFRGARRSKREAMQKEMGRLGSPSVRSGRLAAYGERWDFRLHRVYGFMRAYLRRDLLDGEYKLTLPHRLWAGSW